MPTIKKRLLTICILTLMNRIKKEEKKKIGDKNLSYEICVKKKTFVYTHMTILSILLNPIN